MDTFTCANCKRKRPNDKRDKFRLVCADRQDCHRATCASFASLPRFVSGASVKAHW